MAFRRADGVLSEVVDGRAVLVAPDGSELITLNPLGTRVWEALGAGRDPHDLAAEIAHESPGVGSDRISADISAFLDELQGLGLVVLGGAAAG